MNINGVNDSNRSIFVVEKMCVYCNVAVEMFNDI